MKVDLIAASLILSAACAASSAMGQQAVNGVATASVADTPRESAAGTVLHPPIAYTPSAPSASYVAPGKSLLSVNTVLPNVEFNALSEATVQDIHLRPLYTTAIRLPHPVTTVAVGAPTLFEAEHNDQDPELVFVKPSTHDPAQSNLLISMVTGETVSVRLLSPGRCRLSRSGRFRRQLSGKAQPVWRQRYRQRRGHGSRFWRRCSSDRRRGCGLSVATS